MKTVSYLFILLLCMIFQVKSLAHPGSGIVVDESGNVYFTDTGKGVWKIDPQGSLSYIPSSRFHWMTIDPEGQFAVSPKNFGLGFEKVSLQPKKPVLIMNSDFPVVINTDGNLYYADTRHSVSKIIRRTVAGTESVLSSDRIFAFINGIAAGESGCLYFAEASRAHANTIRKITSNGTVSIVATVPSYCRGLAMDPTTGVLYVAATGSRSVLKITPQGLVQTILQESKPWAPTGVAVYKGEVYILEWKDVDPSLSEVREAYIPRVRKIGIDGKVTTLATVSR